MTELDVHEIICPTIERERNELRAAQRAATAHILWLREQLHAADPTFPANAYDGIAWHTAQETR